MRGAFRDQSSMFSYILLEQRYLRRLAPTIDFEASTEMAYAFLESRAPAAVVLITRSSPRHRHTSHPGGDWPNLGPLAGACRNMVEALAHDLMATVNDKHHPIAPFRRCGAFAWRLGRRRSRSSDRGYTVCRNTAQSSARPVGSLLRVP